MTALDTLLRVKNYRTDATVAETREVIAYSYESGLNQTNPFSYTVRSGNAVATALVDALGGVDGSGPELPYAVGLSHDGGANFEVWKVVEQLERGLYVSENGYTAFRGYQVTGEDHVTYHGATLDQMLYGLPGTIPIDGADSGLIASALSFAWVKGLFRTQPIPTMAYTPVIYPYLKDVVFDADVVGDYLDSALKTLLTQVSGLVIPGDYAPLGSRGNFVEDSSDAGLNLAGRARSLAIGFVGLDPYLTVQADPDASDPYRIPLLEDRNAPITIVDDRTSLAAQVAIAGGNTDCGLPVGGVIATPVCINTGHKPTSLAYDASLCVFACTDNAGNGGVYYWPHDGMAYPIGQAIPARGIAYHAPTNMLYAATDNGVMSHSAVVSDPAPWVVVGGLKAKVSKVVVGTGGFMGSVLVHAYTGNCWRRADGTPISLIHSDVPDGYFIVPAGGGIDPAIYDAAAYWGGIGGIGGPNVVTTTITVPPVIVVEVTGNGSGDGLYRFPALDDSGTTHGYPGWTCVSTGSFKSWTYHYMGDEILLVENNDPAAVTILHCTSDPANAATTRIPTPFGEGITALSSLPNTWGTAVMTTLGADALYALGLDGAWTDLNADTTLLDRSLNPVLVNDVYYYGGPLVLGNRTLTVHWFALTTSGVYFSCQRTGGAWQPPDSQSGIINENVVSFAIGAPQTLITRVINRLYACSANGFWVSHNSGANFRSETREKLSLGALWTALGRLVGQTPFAPNDVTSLGPIAPGGTSGTSGRNIPTVFPAPYTLGGDLVIVRALDLRCAWAYRFRHTATTLPFHAISFGTASEIGTDGDVGSATASGQLGQVHIRYLADRSRYERKMTLRMRMVAQEQRIRTLRATHRIAVNVATTPRYTIGFPHDTPLLLYVVKVQWQKQQGDTHPIVTVSASTVLRSQATTIKEFADGVGYTLNRMQHVRSQRAK